MDDWFVSSRDLLPTLLQRFKHLPRDLSHRSELDTLHLRPSTGVTDCPFSVVSNAKREPPSTGDATKNGRPFGLPFELPLLGSTASAQRE